MTMRRRDLITGAAALLVALMAVVAPAEAQNGRRAVLFGHQAWSPLNLPSLVAWWDASYTPGLTFNSGNVSAWTDRKSGIVASQGTGANQPGWSATGLNNKPALSFNGTSQSLGFSSALLPTGTASSTMAVAGIATSSANNERFIEYGAAGGFRGLLAAATTGNEGVDLNATVSAVAGTTSWYSQLFVVATIANNSQAIFQNGNSDGTGAVALTSSGTSGQIGQKGDGSSTGFLNGKLQQALIFSTVLSACQLNLLAGWESWYDGKNGSNLPASNPFKNRPPYVSDAC